jgi:hypothetical protein
MASVRSTALAATGEAVLEAVSIAEGMACTCNTAAGDAAGSADA